MKILKLYPIKKIPVPRKDRNSISSNDDQIKTVKKLPNTQLQPIVLQASDKTKKTCLLSPIIIDRDV